jgi:hypothetical protein
MRAELLNRAGHALAVYARGRSWRCRIARVAACFLIATLSPQAAPGDEGEMRSGAGAATRLLQVKARFADEVSVVRLKTDGPLAKYDVFILRDPHVLVIDLPGLEPGETKADIRGSSSHFGRVRVLPTPRAVQVVLDAREKDAFTQRQVTPLSDGLLLTLGAGERVTKAFAEAERAGNAIEAAAEPLEAHEARRLPRVPEDSGSEGALATAESPPEKLGGAGESPIAREATRLLSVEVRDTSEGALVRLRADGSLVRHRHFILRDPYRLVIDLAGLELDSTDDIQPVQGSGIYIDRVRVGQNPQRVRVVIDAPEEDALVERRLVPLPDGLLITLGRGKTVTKALAQTERP